MLIRRFDVLVILMLFIVQYAYLSVTLLFRVFYGLFLNEMNERTNQRMNCRTRNFAGQYGEALDTRTEI